MFLWCGARANILHLPIALFNMYVHVFATKTHRVTFSLTIFHFLQWSLFFDKIKYPPGKRDSKRQILYSTTADQTAPSDRQRFVKPRQRRHAFVNFQPPIVILNVLVVEAEGLEAKDANGFRKGREVFILKTSSQGKRHKGRIFEKLIFSSLFTPPPSFPQSCTSTSKEHQEILERKAICSQHM
jgi:hypothetical protein